MVEVAQPVSILSELDCWERLSGVALGRLVTSVDGRSEIFPINFVVQDRTVLFRTAEGTKLVSAAINDEDRAAAERAALRPWTAPAKDHYVRIRPSRGDRSTIHVRRRRY